MRYRCRQYPIGHGTGRHAGHVSLLVFTFFFTVLFPSAAAAQDIDFFLEQFRSEDPAERATALEELSSHEGPRVADALAAGLQDPSAFVRSSAAAAAIGHTEKGVIRALVDAFDDEDDTVRHTVVSVFIMNNTPIDEGYAPLLSLLESTDQRLRAYAAWAVGLYEDPESIPHLRRLFTNGDSLQRANVCWAIGAIGSTQGVDMLHEGLSDRDAQVRVRAAAAAGRVESDVTTARLRRVLAGDKDMACRKAAAESLGALGDLEALPKLVDAMRDGNPDLSGSAMKAIEQMLDPSIRKDLQRALADGNRRVRLFSAHMLGRLGDPRSVKALERALDQETDGEVRSRLEETIHQLSSLPENH